MDAGERSTFELMVTTAELAARNDFRLGKAIVSPSTRTVHGPGGSFHVEPRVLQVLVVLADSAGSVVTRDVLFSRCWGGVYVGDDSLNRAVAIVRRIAEGIAEGSFEIETIPRTGYRLTGADPQTLHSEQTGSAETEGSSRRRFVGAGLAATAAASGTGLWWLGRDRINPRFATLMAQGQDILLGGEPYEPNVTTLYEKAVQLEPSSAKAWGLLAYFTSNKVEGANPEESYRLTAKAEGAIRQALAIDPKETNALTAMYLLKGPMLDWVARDRQLRNILRIEPDNIPALGLLMVLLQSAGLTRESWELNERLLQLAPFSRNHLVFRAMKLWILGRVADSDRVIDRVRGLWPLYGFGISIRLMLFALTGRPKAAQAMLDGLPDRDEAPVTTALWRPALAALDTRTPAAIEAARIACLEGARKTPRSVNIGVMILCALNQVDDAFQIAEGYLLRRGKIISAHRPHEVTNDINRRMPPWLFTPPLAVMRADPRFARLCEDLGLAAYWRVRGMKPDYLQF